MDDDDSDSLYKRVMDWHYTMTMLPSWSEALEIEYARVHANINMFTDDVETKCHELGLHDGANWYKRCFEEINNFKSVYKYPLHPSEIWGVAVKRYEKISGPQSTWITKDIVNEFSAKLKK